jgi:adenylate kinase
VTRKGEGLNAILLGPQGVGKGTQGEIVAPQLRLVRIATGDLLRAAIASGSALGQQAKTYYDRGALVPDAIVVGMVVEKLQAAGAAEPPYQGALFDGFPRNRTQAESLDAALAPIGQQIDRVVNIDAPREVLIARVTARVTCGNCGTIYNLQTNPPKVAGVCDVCGSTDLRRRADDTEEALRERLRLYDEQTQPLLDYYQQRGVVREVNGDQSIASVTNDVLAALQ